LITYNNSNNLWIKMIICNNLITIFLRTRQEIVVWQVQLNFKAIIHINRSKIIAYIHWTLNRFKFNRNNNYNKNIKNKTSIMNKKKRKKMGKILKEIRISSKIINSRDSSITEVVITQVKILLSFNKTRSMLLTSNK
jgi:hypothetical protein